MLFDWDVESKMPIEQPPGHSMVWLDRFDPADFHYRLSTCRELAIHARDLAKGRKECGILVGKDGFAMGYVLASWQSAPVAELGGALPLAEDEGYLFNGYIIPEFRRLRLYPYLLNQGLLHVHRSGSRKVLGVVHTRNAPAFKTMLRVGYSPFKVAHVTKIGLWRRVAWADRERPPRPTPPPKVEGEAARGEPRA